MNFLSAQQNTLSITVPVPPSTVPGHSKLKCLKADTTSGGCSPSFASFQDPIPDSENGTCTIRVLRDQTVALNDSTSDRYCGAPHRANEAQFQCPCFAKDGLTENSEDQVQTCSSIGITSFEDYDRCTLKGRWSNIFGSHETGDAVTRLAFAGDVRAIWVDPDDAWTCVCDCDDPSTPGATITARLQGCAEGGLKPDEDEDMAEACEEACGGHVCGSAPDCRIGTCHASALPELGARLIARDACHAEEPDPRVADAADFEVRFDPNQSTLDLGSWADGTFTSQLDAPVAMKGFAFANDNRDPSDRRLQFADFQLATDGFTIPARIVGVQVGSIPVTASGAFVTARFDSLLGPRADDEATLAANEFMIPAGKMSLGVRGATPFGTGGAEFLNAGPFTGTFDPATRQFTLDVVGMDEEQHAAKLHIVGSVVNTPPHADAGRDATVECTSPTKTAVALDGLASTDDDPGDSVRYYQWFENGGGLGNTAQVIANATLGAHVYELHVYDRDLGSDAAFRRVSVVDTAGPVIDVPTTDFCVWPPNHEFAMFRLTDELQATARDTCDAAPSLRIAAVTATESADMAGSGNTAPDVVFGPTTACVRSERSGLGEGRRYDVTLEAVDASGNNTQRVVRVTVPHDGSGHPGCIRATGLMTPDERCTQ